MRWIRFGFLLLLVGVAVFLIRMQTPSRTDVARVRAIWVTRFDYSRPDDLERIFNNLAGRGFTDVFFQIRGSGTVYYSSQMEPWAYQLSGDHLALLGTDPGWDPLQRAVDLAHQRGLRLHAYMNVLSGWSGLQEPPPGARQLWTEHPDWFMVDASGDRMQPTADWYAFLNPAVPGVRAHLRGLVAELCMYDVDGVHLDYIRYPHDYLLVAKKRYPDATGEELKRKSSFSWDPVSLAQQRKQFGESPSAKEIRAFRRDSVTRVVRDFSLLTEIKRGQAFVLSASVLGDPNEAAQFACQDSGLWVKQGLLDWAVQMNYNSRRFDDNLAAMRKAVGSRGWTESVVVGLLCENEVEDVLRQINVVERSGCRGYALFGYGLLFDAEHRITEKGRILLERIHP